MRAIFLLMVAMLFSAAPTTAQTYSINGHFKGVIIDGTRCIRYYDTTREQECANLADKDVSGGVAHFLYYPDPNLEDVFNLGNFTVDVVNLDSALISVPVDEFIGFGRWTFYEDRDNFALHMRGRGNPNDNNHASMSLFAEKRGDKLVNWHGVYDGYVYLRGTDIFYYSVSQTRFFIDDDSIIVSGVSFIPESDVWIAMIIGFGLVGSVIRKQRGSCSRKEFLSQEG